MNTHIPYAGLTAAEVLQSRKLHGANVLTPPRRESLWKRFAERLTGPFGHHIKGWHDGDHLIFILEVAALLSVFVSVAEYNGWFGLTREGAAVFFEPVGIIIAILLATGIAFIFEVKADREFSILNQVNDEEPVQVIRDGTAQRIKKCDVVVGDVLLLSTGEEIPADAELLEAVQLSIDESTLTGEPICRKTVISEEMDADATFPSNHVMRGTKVMEGHGVAHVLAVGDQTENGRVFTAAQIDDSVRTPLDEQLNRLGRLISWGSYAVALLVIVGRVVAYLLNEPFVAADFIAYVLQTFMIAVTLIVVAVPEGLPMAVSLSLAYSMRSMLKTNNLVRKLHACETMGAATVICTDKTGTLTQNQMQVAEIFEVSSSLPPSLLQENMAVNSTARLDLRHEGRPEVLGNPTEGALLLWLHEGGIDYQQLRNDIKVIDEIPFTTELKYMATLVQHADGGQVLYVKGAPEIVMGLCSIITDLDVLQKRLEQYQSQAMRTLAFACQKVVDGEQVITDGRLTARNLQLLGLVSISDPVRPDVPPAVVECLCAGINIKIVTGDTPGTAREIGRQIGLWTDADGEQNETTGPELAAMSDEELEERACYLKLIARARPMDKKRLVEALQRRGEVVAVTGDGTNDAPALRTAHVGLSMGDGTSVAKEASDITIVDNSFASIGRAVMWGRSLYRNIQRFILFQLTVNIVACLVVLVGAFMGTESPLTVVQMLWVNLIMDTFAAMALASLPPSLAVMLDKPRSRTALIITRPMRRTILITGLLFFLLLFGLLWVLEHADITCATQMFTVTFGTKDMLTPYELTFFFTVFVMLQFWNILNARAFATGRSAFHLRGCHGFLFIAAVILVGQVLIVSFGGRFFNVVPLSVTDWFIIIGITSFVLWTGEVVRLFIKGKKVRK